MQTAKQKDSIVPPSSAFSRAMEAIIPSYRQTAAVITVVSLLGAQQAQACNTCGSPPSGTTISAGGNGGNGNNGNNGGNGGNGDNGDNGGNGGNGNNGDNGGNGGNGNNGNNGGNGGNSGTGIAKSASNSAANGTGVGIASASGNGAGNTTTVGGTSIKDFSVIGIPGNPATILAPVDNGAGYGGYGGVACPMDTHEHINPTVTLGASVVAVGAALSAGGGGRLDSTPDPLCGQIAQLQSQTALGVAVVTGQSNVLANAVNAKEMTCPMLLAIVDTEAAKGVQDVGIAYLLKQCTPQVTHIYGGRAPTKAPCVPAASVTLNLSIKTEGCAQGTVCAPKGPGG